MACNVKNNLESFGCEVTFLTAEPSRKIRLVDKRSGHHIARIDHDPAQVTPITFNPEMLEGVDIVVVSDYNKGAVASDLIMDLVHWFDGPVYIDTKKTDLAKFEGGIVKINQDEYSKITSECSNMIVTLGGDGTRYDGVIYKAPMVSVYDVVGAGDVFLAALAYRHSEVGDIRRAITFANHAAATSVKHAGVYTLTSEDINEIRRIC